MAKDGELFDLERFRLPAVESANGNGANTSTTRRPPRHRRGERFLRGPIPWEWLLRAANLGRGPLTLALVLWRLVGIRDRREVALAPADWSEVFRDRKTYYRALERLEAAGLVTVARHRGRGPTVILRNVGTEGEGRVNP